MNYLKGINLLKDGDKVIGKFDVVSQEDRTPTLVLSKEHLGDKNIYLEEVPNKNVSNPIGARREFKIVIK